MTKNLKHSWLVDFSKHGRH